MGFSAGKTLAPGEKLMIWADEDGKAPSGLHANFKLSSRGESLFLSQRENGQIILMDHLEYKDAKPDQVICLPRPSTFALRFFRKPLHEVFLAIVGIRGPIC